MYIFMHANIDEIRKYQTTMVNLDENFYSVFQFIKIKLLYYALNL